MMNNPLVSILTPTGITHYGHDRWSFLPLTYECVRNQRDCDFEWLVLDVRPHASPLPASSGDQQVRYIHEPGPMSIGARRNRLCSEARGEIIAMFDDDDYYAPHYLAQMVSLLKRKNVDVVKLFGFFVFRTADPTSLHYYDRSGCMYEGKYSSKPILAVTGFGFSYVFPKRVWEVFQFPDREHGEDQEFIDNVLGSGFELFGIQDKEHGSCIHIEHGRNISICYPQFSVKNGLLELFPAFPADAYVDAAAKSAR
jgi:glycosyltransferase involved in cell wall biosynthesis